MAPVFRSGSRQFSLAADARQLKIDAMRRHGWLFVTSETPAIFPLWDRLIDAVRRNRPLTIRQWVKDIPIHVCAPGSTTRQAFVSDAMRPYDEQVSVELATFMSARSFLEHGVQVGVFVIDARLNRPPDGYFTWAARVGLPGGRSSDDQLALALSEMARAGRAYGVDAASR